ncbi:unnamed protein product [Ectocarpus fasciculatus]
MPHVHATERPQLATGMDGSIPARFSLPCPPHTTTTSRAHCPLTLPASYKRRGVCWRLPVRFTRTHPLRRFFVPPGFFSSRLLNRDKRIRNPPQAAVDRMLANPATRSALERANADMAAAASKQ